MSRGRSMVGRFKLRLGTRHTHRDRCTVGDAVPSIVPENPRPEPRLLACQNHRPGQSRQEAVILARLGSAYLGLAWPGSRPEAGPSTSLEKTERKSWNSSGTSSSGGFLGFFPSFFCASSIDFVIPVLAQIFSKFGFGAPMM